jgi:hypothetical protein
MKYIRGTQMTLSRKSFAESTEPHAANKAAPFSLRLTFEERTQLEKKAAGMALGAYIRDRLLGEDAAPRRSRGKFPVKDYEALGRVLATLGQSRLSSNLNQLARAANTGSLPVSPDTEEALKEACAEVAALRADLLRALGSQEGGGV